VVTDALRRRECLVSSRGKYIAQLQNPYSRSVYLNGLDGSGTLPPRVERGYLHI